METKQHVNKLDRIKRKCGFDACIGVNSEGTSGGIAMIWKDDITMNLRSFSKNYIDLDVGENSGQLMWRVIGFYGDPNVSRQNES